MRFGCLASPGGGPSTSAQSWSPLASSPSRWRTAIVFGASRPTGVDRSAAGGGLDVPGLEPLAAFGAGQLGEHDVTAGAVPELDGRPGVTSHPAVAPAQH